MTTARNFVFHLIQYSFVLLSFTSSSRVSPLLPQYSVHVTGCDGRRIAKNDVAGELTYKSVHVRDNYPRSKMCDFTISPKEIQAKNTQVMFYFTHFKLGGYCVDNNVTVYDGNLSHLHGLGEVLCGYNSSLENRVFTSTSSEIRIVIRWSEDRINTASSFEMVFIAFYKGPCTSENGYFTCTNNRCISSTYSCHDEINYCGNGTDPKCIAQGAQRTVLKTLVNMARNVFFIMGLLVGISLLKKFCYNRLKAKHGSVLNFPVIRKIFSHSNTSSRERRRFDTDRQNTVNNEEVLILTDIPPSNNGHTAAVFVGPPPYEEIQGNSHDILPNGGPSQTYSVVPYLPPGALSAIPPPSYEEVIANNHRCENKSNNQP